MSKTEQKKLKGIVSISSDDFYSGKKQQNENEIINDTQTNNQNKKLISSEPKEKIIKKKPISKPNHSSSSRSIQLPDSFFEQILECEFKLKEKFDAKTFYDLINLYSSAINFYESIKDPRFITFNQSLNLLFSMPDVKKYMEGTKSLTKKEKIKDIEKRMLQSEKKITKEKVNKIYLQKIQKNFGKNIINEEFNKQSNLFKKRKEEKKKKYLLSTSALPHIKKKLLNKENINNIEISNNNHKNENKSFDNANPQDDDDDFSDFDDSDNMVKTKKVYQTENKKTNPINLVYGGENNVLDDLKKEDLKNEINKISILGNGNDSDKNYLDDTLSFSNSDNILIDISKIQRITNKTLFQENLKSNMDTYISEFYNIFLDKIMNSIIKDYIENGNIIEKKLIDSSTESNEQKKQMEFLKGSSGDEKYNEEIESMLQQIMDEEEEAKIKIIKEAEYREKILSDKYINNNINSMDNSLNHRIDMLKEKLKLEVTKAVNSIILK